MKETFKCLYEKYNFDLFNFLFYMVRNREQAELLSREVYIQVLNSYDQFESKSNEKIYLFSIAQQVAVDRLKKKKRQSLLCSKEENSPLPKEIAIQDEKMRRLFKCIGQCTNEQRSVLVLRFIQKFSIQETSDILGCSDRKVKTEQRKGMMILKDHIL